MNQVRALCGARKCVLLLCAAPERGAERFRETDICVRISVSEEAQCGVFLKNKCEVS